MCFCYYYYSVIRDPFGVSLVVDWVDDVTMHIIPIHVRMTLKPGEVYSDPPNHYQVLKYSESHVHIKPLTL